MRVVTVGCIRAGMSDAPSTPVFTKRSKPRGSRVSLGSTVDAEPAEEDVSPITLAAKLKKTRLKPKARLSFGGDNEVIVPTALDY